MQDHAPDLTVASSVATIVLMAEEKICPACRAAEQLKSPDLCMVAGVAWGVVLVGGFPAAIGRARTRELFCEAHAEAIFDTSRMMKEIFHADQSRKQTDN